jgi:Fe-S-cluster containining protein
MFPCTKCGACCRVAGTIPGFEEPLRPDGACSHLQPDDSCAIYETRPFMCRVDEQAGWEGVPEYQWHAVNARACNQLQEAEGVPAKFRLPIWEGPWQTGITGE